MSRTYKVPITITFKGTLTVQADNRSLARTYAQDDFWAIIDTMGTNDTDHITNWDVAIHNDTLIVGPPKAMHK